MISSLKGMLLTLVSTINGFRKPVTAQYPNQHLPIQPRYMGFPALTWDEKVGEPYCTSCMVCIRNCPTLCMSSTMMDNPLLEEGKSSRKKIVDSFEINLNRCILCGICVDVCNFDAIVMTHEHELSTYERNGDRVDLPGLLEMGKRYQKDTNWTPPSELAKKASAKAAAGGEQGAAPAPPANEAQPEDKGD